MLRNHGYRVAHYLLHEMDSYNGEQPFNTYLRGFIARAIRWDHGIINDNIAGMIQYLQGVKKRKRRLEYQASPEYRKMFKLKIARRAERDGMDVEAYVQASIMRVAAGYIMHGLHEDHLEELLAGWVDSAFLDACSKDSE